MEDKYKKEIAQLEDYIMKNCLWQFHSRSWDRKKQNEEILTKTRQILCQEPVEKESPADRCYWVDAVILAEEFKKYFSWIISMKKEDISEMMQGLKERIDYLTITGSLNLELNDSLY